MHSHSMTTSTSTSLTANDTHPAHWHCRGRCNPRRQPRRRMKNVVKINPRTPQRWLVQQAATVLRKGGLVAFPTETVYGLGADALDKAAVEKIFRAKQRPTWDPLIVHVRDVATARLLAKQLPPA